MVTRVLIRGKIPLEGGLWFMEGIYQGSGYTLWGIHKGILIKGITRVLSRGKIPFEGD